MQDHNEVLNLIIDDIEIWRTRPLAEHLKDRCCTVERERGFQEGLRLSGALVRAKLIRHEEEEEIDSEEE